MPNIDTFDQAVDAFVAEMKAKFWARDEKHGEQSIVRLDSAAAAKMKGLVAHFWSEVIELRAAQNDTTELVDVANMCFARWWKEKDQKELSLNPKATEQCPDCHGDGYFIVGDGDEGGGCHEEGCRTCKGAASVTPEAAAQYRAAHPPEDLPFPAPKNRR